MFRCSVITPRSLFVILQLSVKWFFLGAIICRIYWITWSHALHILSLILPCLLPLRVVVPHVPRALRALVPYVLSCLSCLTCFRTSLTVYPISPRGSRILCLKCPCLSCSTWFMYSTCCHNISSGSECFRTYLQPKLNLQPRQLFSVKLNLNKSCYRINKYPVLVVLVRKNVFMVCMYIIKNNILYNYLMFTSHIQ